MNTMNDTIAAIATANATGAVSLIRISGDEAIEIASQLIQKDLSSQPGYTIQYGTIYEEKEAIDEVLVSIFRAPKSYTGENVIEIGCHGGLFITRKILSLILSKGARLARRGEFTERAFLHGKMDLSQAEGVNDLIHASDEVNARSAMHSLKGSVSKILEPLQENLTQIISNIEVNIDYPEYDDVHQLTEEEILPMANAWLQSITMLIEEAKKAVNIREGIDTVILGRPNVGKSSLLNALLEEDKAIVTDIAGTTRDIVEGSVRLDGITLNLIDTAGIHEASDVVEKIGIEKSLKALEKAELVIVVLDGSSELTEEDENLLELTKDRNRIIVYNKNDKDMKYDGLSISAINKDVTALEEAIKEKYEKDLLLASSDTLNNERQIALAMQAKTSMENAIQTLQDGMELDLVTIDLEKAWTALKQITGEVGKEDLLDEIFSRFCLGK